MAQQNVWVRFDEQGQNPTKVSVVNCNDVDDLVKATLKLLMSYQSVSPNLVSVTFGGDKVRPGALVSDYVTMTSDDKPLLLHITHKKRKVDVGECLIVHTLCSYCSCTYLGIVIVVVCLIILYSLNNVALLINEVP